MSKSGRRAHVKRAKVLRGYGMKFPRIAGSKAVFWTRNWGFDVGQSLALHGPRIINLANAIRSAYRG
jgi:hypothetical protein